MSTIYIRPPSRVAFRHPEVAVPRMTDALLARLDPRDYAAVARFVLDTPTFEWIRSGAGDEHGPGHNEAAFARWRLKPRVLVDVTTVRTETTILGTTVAAPVMVAPMGLLRAVHPDGELATSSGVSRAGSLYVVGVNALASVEDIAAAAPAAPLWFQLYNWEDREALAAVIARAEAAGCRAIVPLVNTAVSAAHTPARVGFRPPAGARFGHFEVSPELTTANDWEYLRWITSVTKLPVVPKGIMAADDARRAADAGASGIMISNHGGRQLPRSLATLDVLAEVVAAVDAGVEVYLDGGVRTGGDVLVALALGARAVSIGRPVAWGLAVGGAEGVARVLDRLREELASDAGLCGIVDVGMIPDDVVVRAA